MALGIVITFTIGTSPIRILSANPSRRGLSFIAAQGNAGVVYVNFDDPAISTVGSKQGIPLNAGAQGVEREPINTGELWAIASAANQILFVNELF